jgi:hypothetical protein
MTHGLLRTRRSLHINKRRRHIRRLTHQSRINPSLLKHKAVAMSLPWKPISPMTGTSLELLLLSRQYLHLPQDLLLQLYQQHRQTSQ